MDKPYFQIIACVLAAFLFCFATRKSLGAMQQSGYKNGVFWRWLTRKDNLFFNRIAVFSLCLALASGVFSLCFSFLGSRGALLCSSIPFFALSLTLIWADNKYALKVPTKNTARLNRLFIGYLIFTGGAAFGIIKGLDYLAVWNGSDIYALIAYIPFAVLPLLLPVVLVIVNALLSIFENGRNHRFVRKGEKKLQNTKILRVGVVGSYGKTSTKNILKTLLSEKYAVVATPESYNTPIGIAKTVFSKDFEDAEVFIAEMGAKKSGDIVELCRIVKPDYGIFTGVCAQHLQTFGTIDAVWEEKSEILRCGAKQVVCGQGLCDFVTEKERGTCLFHGEIENLILQATKTSFTLSVHGEKTEIVTPLLGAGNAENIALCVRICERLGLTREEILRGLAKVTPIPHRLQLIESGGVYILDDGYNSNPVGAKIALDALSRFEKGKCVVTPGIVECGILEEEINGGLGEDIAKGNFDKVILVGDTLIGAVKDGYIKAGGDIEKVVAVKTLDEAQAVLSQWVQKGDAVLFLNDLPDVY